MNVTLPQINQLIDRLSDPLMGPEQLASAQEELKRYESAKPDASMQPAINRARVLLWLKEEQASTAAKINQLVLGLLQCKQYLSSHPQLSVAEYTNIQRSLAFLRAQGEPLTGDDFILMSKPQFFENLQICEMVLDQRNPSAWKTDLLIRGLLAGSVMALYGYRNGPIGIYHGLLGVLLAFGIEKGTGFLVRKTISAFSPSFA